MWWCKIPVLLAVATANHISLSDHEITKLRARSSLVGYLIIAFKTFFWTLTACEVLLIWSVNHLRSPISHRILVTIVHPRANFPPRPRISLLFAAAWSISLLSLTTYLVYTSRYQRIRQSYTSLEHGHNIPRRRIQVIRRIIHGSSPVLAIGSTSCSVVPGSFAYECWVWQMRLGGTLFCLVGVSYVVFWLVMVVWRCVRSQRRRKQLPPLSFQFRHLQERLNRIPRTGATGFTLTSRFVRPKQPAQRR